MQISARFFTRSPRRTFSSALTHQVSALAVVRVFWPANIDAVHRSTLTFVLCLIGYCGGPVFDANRTLVGVLSYGNCESLYFIRLKKLSFLAFADRLLLLHAPVQKKPPGVRSRVECDRLDPRNYLQAFGL